MWMTFSEGLWTCIQYRQSLLFANPMKGGMGTSFPRSYRFRCACSTASSARGLNETMPRKEASFEQLFHELEKTVEQLEAGNLTLDESLALYERGMELAKQCGERLDRAELRIRELAPVRSEQVALDEFDDLDEEDDRTEETDE